MLGSTYSLWETWSVDYPGGWWSTIWFPSENLQAKVFQPKYKVDLAKLNPGARIVLYTLEYNGVSTRFHSGVNEFGSSIIWQGKAYNKFPIKADGFERNSTGTLPRPRLVVANISGVISVINKSNEDLVGAKVTRHITFVKYLDAINFINGNPTADSEAEFPPEIWYIDRKVNENPVSVEWELTAPWDVVGIKLPRRQFIANSCVWKYRGAECGYAGDPVADELDNPTFDPLKDRCSKKLSACKLRFGENNQLPFGGFPSVGLIR